MSRIDIFKVALVSFVFSYALSYFFYRKNLYIGNKEKSTFGGIVIYSAIFGGFLLSGFRFEYSAWIMFLPFVFMFLLGIWDDYKALSPYVKLFFQVLIIIGATFLGFRTRIIYLPIFLNYIITIIWMLVITNAFNFLDIMDGLCIGNILFASLTFSIIAFIKFQPLNLIFSVLIFSSCLGFLPFNYKKARAYLGDSGSLSLGFFLSLLAVSFSYAREDKPLALLTPVIIMGLPIFDFIYVTGRRLLQGKSVFKKSPDHLAILMKNGGVGKEKIVHRFWFISFGFAFSALVLQFGSYLVGVLALIFAITLFSELMVKYYK